MDQMPKKPSAIRFLAFDNDEQDAKTTAMLKEAAEKIQQAVNREESLNELIDYKSPTEEITDLANDTRPLYERLLEQKNKKKEDLEDLNKLSNLIVTLDEDDAEYLNHVAKVKQEEEIQKRLQIYDAMEEKKRVSERRIVEDEQKMKEILIGSRASDRGVSSIRSRLSSLIKIKPKTKTLSSDPSTSQGQMNQKPAEQSKDSNQQMKRFLPSDEIPESNKNIVKNNVQPDSECKRKKIDDECLPKDVMRCIGILPSMPTVDKFHDSSDDSDDSSNNLNVRIVPRVGKSRRRH